MVDTKLVERLRKVQALTTSSNPGEAAAATAKLQELLFKYNIDIKDVDVDRPDSERLEGYTRERVDIKFAESWRRNLLHGIATANLCTTVYTQGTPLMWIVGTKANVDAVWMMYEYVSTAAIRMAHKAWRDEAKSMKEEGWTPRGGNAWVRSFLVGAANEVVGRLHAKKREMMADTTTTALVVATDELLREAMAKYFGQLGKGRRSSHQLNGRAYDAGRRAGSSIGLEPQVGGSNGKALR